MLQRSNQILLSIVAMAALFLLQPSPARANQRISTLGRDTLGETLKKFQLRYPKATCGRAISTEITPQNLVNSGNMDDIHCCLNDRDSLNKISRFPILNFDDCAVHTNFWKSRLRSLSYTLDVRTLQTVLPFFVKLYGPPTQISEHPKDDGKLIFVNWMDHDMTLELVLSRLGGEDYHKGSTRPKGQPWLDAVTVDLWDSA